MNQQEEFQHPISSFDGADEGISIAELFHIFRKRFRWFILGLVLVMALAVGYLQITVPEYESQVSVLVDPIQKSSSFEGLLDMSGSSTKIATEVELITSRRNIEFALGTLDLASYRDSDGNAYSDPLVLGNVKNRIVVSTVKDTNIVKITVTDQNPAFARDLSNALAASYDELLTGISKNSKTAQREFIESQIPINDRALSIASDALGDFRETSDIIQLSDKSSLLVEQISYFTLRLEPLKLQRIEALSFIDGYHRTISDANLVVGYSIDALKNDPVVSRLLQDLSARKTELTMYESLPGASVSAVDTSGSSVFSSSNRLHVINSAVSDVSRQLVDRIATLTRAYGTEAYTQALMQVLTTDVGIEVLQNRADVFSNELSQLPVLERRLSELTRDVQIYEAIGLKLREMLEEVKLIEAAVTGNVTVVDEAVLPKNPVSPNKLLILAVAILLGCAIGLLMTLGIEALETSIQSEQQIHKIVGKEFPVLGWIPLMRVSSSEKYPTLAVYNDPLSFESERFKLIANLLHNKSENQVYSITSCAMAEGKSTIIGNIALALAQMGSKVLVIDGDLRLPSMERYFRLKHREIGLVDYVAKKITLEQCIVQPFEKVPTLHLLPPGNAPLVPAAIFSNPRYAQTIKALRSQYDFIIIDAPPLDSASELLSISKHVDGLIVTVRAGITSKGSLYDLVSNLRTAKAPLIGFVFNGVMPGAISSYGYGYGYGYGRGYSSYAYRYGYGYSGAKQGKKKHKSHLRGRSISWYRKRYKIDLKMRGKILTEQFEPVLAFGPDSPYATMQDWSQALRDMDDDVSVVEVNKVAPATEIRKDEVLKETLDPLAQIEEDEAASGKKNEQES
jgi:capsular exopolysaccharide synthesis family protein